MSTLKANKVRNVSATVDNLELDSSGNVSVYGVGDVATALAAKAATSAIKIKQIVRATDTNVRQTTSGTFVDSGLSVTITPTSASNSILLISVTHVEPNGTDPYGGLQITTSANVAVSGAESAYFGFAGGTSIDTMAVLFGYASPATTSAVTYKLRYRVVQGTDFYIRNQITTGQLYAIEVAS